MKFKRKIDWWEIIIFLYIIAITIVIVGMAFIPLTQLDYLNPIISALLAIGTFIMALITYKSYKSLITIQKASLEPALAATLWKKVSQIPATLSDYGITIKNDGPGIAKNVRLLSIWASRVREIRKVEKLDFRDSDFEKYGVEVEVGNIASKEEINVSLPFPRKLKPIDAYGIKVKVTCKDILGNIESKYGDIKNIYLGDAKTKGL
jgi:hypothetical protein